MAVPDPGIGHALEQLVGKNIVSRVRKLAVGSSRPHLATADVLVRLNGVQDVPDVGEVHAPVVSAEVVATPIIRRVADRESRIETLIGAGREKHVIDVLVSSLVAGRGNGVYHGKHVVIRKGSTRERTTRRVWLEVDSCPSTNGVAVICAQSDVLIDQVDETALPQVTEKAFRISPAAGDSATPVWVEINSM